MINQRSAAYVFTADPLCASSMQEINLIRKTARAINAHNKICGHRERYRVTLRGRLGKNNPSAAKYQAEKFLHPWRNPYQTIRLADAQAIDVYVHLRSR